MPRARGPLFLPQPVPPQLPFHFRQQVFDRQLLQILRVEPFELRPVEHAVRAAYALQSEFLEQVFRPQELLIPAWRPAEQRQKISERFGQEALAPVHVYVRGSMAFGQPGLVRSEDQRHMREHRQFGAERPIEQNLFRRVRNVVRAANHMRDPHVDIVHHHAHLIHRLPELFALFSRAQQHKIFNLVV